MIDVMQISKSKLLIGVALIVTPIFSSAVYAQKSNDAAALLLQMQEMRQEIGEPERHG